MGINDISINKYDPLIRPPSLRDNSTAGYASFVPAYNCTVRPPTSPGQGEEGGGMTRL